MVGQGERCNMETAAGKQQVRIGARWGPDAGAELRVLGKPTEHIPRFETP